MNERPTLLCLGVSYPCLTQVLQNNGHDPEARDWRDCTTPSQRRSKRIAGTTNDDKTAPDDDNLLTESIEDILECARRRYLSEIDARDLARCVATEIHASVKVYTVSQENGAHYDASRHLDANFNRSSFVRLLKKTFLGIQFDQVALDYFWIPPGWDKSHWKTSFFEQTLVNLADQNVLKQPISPKAQSTEDVEKDNYRIKEGTVFLPFCFHCVTEVLASTTLLDYYDISFVRKGELDDVALWAGTQQIDRTSMQHVLGKHLNQEDTYCTFLTSDVREGADNPRIEKEQVLKVLRRLEDFQDIRFIALTRLPKGKQKGRLLGLADDASCVKRGIDHASGAKTAPQLTTPSQTRQKRRAMVVTPTSTCRLSSIASAEEASPSKNTKSKRKIVDANSRGSTKSKRRKYVATPATLRTSTTAKTKLRRSPRLLLGAKRGLEHSGVSACRKLF